ncbi:MAG: DNA cytosine methyltransferase [Planctomycetes bacterium]|nr:DNA cytosine methyltransferase [Planctomycetota bacterium]
MNNKTLISFFSGALGLDLGLEKAGFALKAVVECNQLALETIRNNCEHLNGNRHTIVDQTLTLDNVTEICERILDKTRLKKNPPFLLAGAPPCQPFSTAGKRASMQDIRSNGFEVFFKAVEVLKPKFFVIENVKGILSSAKSHRPLAERGAGFPPLSPNEEHGSAFKEILDSLSKLSKKMGYCVSWGVVNAADFGCPQVRDRVLLIGSLDGHFVWPEPTHSKERKKGLKKWVTLKKGLKRLNDSDPLYNNFSPSVSKYLKLIPEGGNWKSLPENKQADALGGAFYSWGGRSGFLRRLSWDRPAPTITSSPKSKATMLCHPEETRPLTVRECARIQQFPDTWDFAGSLSQQYLQIGNATPVSLGTAIGEAIIKASKRRKKSIYSKQLLCADPELLQRMIKRPKTMLNPTRMRKIKDPQKTSRWLNSNTRYRDEFQKYKSFASIA